MGVVQRYELDEQIGVGGMAEIHRARAIAHDGTSLPVVIKRIHPRYSEDAEYKQMFMGEARIAGVLDHPNIVRLLDVGQMDDRLFIAMELVEGRDLQTVLRYARENNIRFSPAAALHVTSQVLEALHHAHSRKLDDKPLKIVHRDITPQNVLIAKNGSVKVTDFGLAKAAIRPGQTVAGVIKGNIRYMAPEQVGAKDVDSRTDLYAAGMILHALLSGRHPFEDEPLVKAISRCITGDVPTPEARAGVTRPLIDIVMKSVSAEPSTRYQTASEFLAAIRRIAGPGELASGRVELAKLVQLASLPSALPPSPRAHSIAARLGPLIAEATGDESSDSFFSSGNKATPLAPPPPPKSITFGGHSELITGLAMFPDGLRVASSSADRTVRIWNIGKQREEKVLRGHDAGVLCCAVSPSGELIFSGGRDNRARLWEVATGATIWVLDSAAPVSSIAFSRGGDVALVGTEDYSATIWDYGRRKPLMPLAGHRDVVSACAFTPDGRLAITGSYDGLVRIFDAKTGALQRALEGDSETDSVSALAVSADGTLLASGGSSSVIRIWEIATGVELRTLIGHRAPVTGLAFATDGFRVLSSALDGTMRLWSAGEEPIRIDAPSAIGAMAAPGDLAWALAGADRAVAFFLFP